MSIALLFLAALLLLILLIYHSFALEGWYLTFSFFVFTFLWAFVKEYCHSPAPYGFINTSISLVIISKFFVIFGWLITFYLGWRIAELILTRLDNYKGNIFIVLLLSCVVIASISYFMETAAVNAGWWQWYVKKPNFRFTRFLVGGCSIRIIEAWVYFGLHCLFSYFLIFRSHYKDEIWRYLFFVLPFTAISTIAWVSPAIELRFLLFFLFALLLFRTQRAESKNIRNPNSYAKRVLFKYIPVLVFAFMILTAALSGIFIAKKPYLLISVLPALLLLVFTIRKLPSSYILLSVIPLAVVIKEKILPILITVIFITILQHTKPKFILHKPKKSKF